MARPQRPTDLYVVNGWWLEMPGLVSPHFETLEGIQRTANKVEIVDAGTNKKYKFGTQIIDYGELTLTRTMQGTADDEALENIVRMMIQGGLKLPVSAVKTHNGEVVFRILFTGFNIHSETHPTMDVNAEEKYLITYAATCDDWEIIR